MDATTNLLFTLFQQGDQANLVRSLQKHPHLAHEFFAKLRENVPLVREKPRLLSSLITVLQGGELDYDFSSLVHSIWEKEYIKLEVIYATSLTIHEFIIHCSNTLQGDIALRPVVRLFMQRLEKRVIRDIYQLFLLHLFEQKQESVHFILYICPSCLAELNRRQALLIADMMRSDIWQEECALFISGCKRYAQEHLEIIYQACSCPASNNFKRALVKFGSDTPRLLVCSINAWECIFMDNSDLKPKLLEQLAKEPSALEKLFKKSGPANLYMHLEDNNFVEEMHAVIQAIEAPQVLKTKEMICYYEFQFLQEAIRIVDGAGARQILQVIFETSDKDKLLQVLDPKWSLFELLVHHLPSLLDYVPKQETAFVVNVLWRCIKAGYEGVAPEILKRILSLESHERQTSASDIACLPPLFYHIAASNPEFFDSLIELEGGESMLNSDLKWDLLPLLSPDRIFTVTNHVVHVASNPFKAMRVYINFKNPPVEFEKSQGEYSLEEGLSLVAKIWASYLADDQDGDSNFSEEVKKFLKQITPQFLSIVALKPALVKSIWSLSDLFTDIHFAMLVPLLNQEDFVATLKAEKNGEKLKKLLKFATTRQHQIFLHEIGLPGIFFSDWELKKAEFQQQLESADFSNSAGLRTAFQIYKGGAPLEVCKSIIASAARMIASRELSNEAKVLVNTQVLHACTQLEAVFSEFETLNDAIQNLTGNKKRSLPEQFIDPLTGKTMTDPVIVPDSDGIRVDLSTVLAWANQTIDGVVHYQSAYNRNLYARDLFKRDEELLAEIQASHVKAKQAKKE